MSLDSFFRRVIETWFDPEYKEFFYTREPLARFVDPGDLSDQLALKKRLQCKSFDWFMKEVAYDVFSKYPKLPPNKYWGELVNTVDSLCLDTYGRHPPEMVGASPCHHGGGNQLFRLNTEGQLSSGEWCTDISGSNAINVQWCAMGTVNGPWEYRESSKQVYHKKSGKCLGVDPESNKPNVRKCDSNNAYQQWTWSKIVPYWSKNEFQD